ncbi:MAG: formate--tetrahydrofolate ligase [Capsulimonadales bacterium]|nr:formate--tetrahydrofolate ligase [Capsulimonadales bacterium]
MPTDIEIAQSVTPRPIADVAADLALSAGEYELFGRHKAKIALSVLDRLQDRPNGKLVLVTAITPTPAGEGNTTMTVGLAQGLNRIGTRCVAALREPSLGPVFGQKGGATGGGWSQVLPMEEINLHFTGDLHAITAANNLLAALIDNHLQSGNALRLEPRTLTWKRCLDMNDRALRDILTGLGGKSEGVPRETGFEITAASEVMAVLCLSEGIADLKERLRRIVVGTNTENEPVTAGELQAVGAMTALLKDALMPNLVQTIEGTPAILHGGPFANIAHGCNSVLATRLALKLGDVCVTEAGFGADLGAEKFLDIKMRQSGLAPSAAVVVATIRALKFHGGVGPDAFKTENVAAVEAGFANLERHITNLRKFGLPVVVAINRFTDDTEAEIAALRARCAAVEAPVALANVWGEGGKGAEELARLVLDALESGADFRFLYPDEMPLRRKIETIAREIYRAEKVEFAPAAVNRLAYLRRRGYDRLPVCIAKTQYSFSDDPERRGAPTGHSLTIRDVKLSAGAGFVVAYAGTLLTMPGLPKRPAAVDIDTDEQGVITGLF